MTRESSIVIMNEVLKIDIQLIDCRCKVALLTFLSCVTWFCIFFIFTHNSLNCLQKRLLLQYQAIYYVKYLRMCVKYENQFH